MRSFHLEPLDLQNSLNKPGEPNWVIKASVHVALRDKQCLRVNSIRQMIFSEQKSHGFKFEF